MFDRLSSADVVFVGETHLDEVTHRLELAIARGLKERRGDVVLSMEMFERDVQETVDNYLSGEIGEDQFLSEARPWNNYVTGYRPLIEWAKEVGAPVVAANVPGPLRRNLMMGGPDALDRLSGEERAGIAGELFPGTERYWQRFDRAVRGHGHAPAAGADRTLSTQNLWDNTMGESVALALEAHPGAVIIHYNGAFHTLEKDGTARQFILRRPDASVQSVHIMPTGDLVSARAKKGDRRADFIVAAEALSRGYQDGTLAVMAPRELRYRISSGKSEGAASLLIWLGAASSPPGDELVRLRAELGESVTIAVVEPLYPQIEEDLHLGGVWFWDHSFDGDIGTLSRGLARLRDTLLRQREIDPQRVLLAGEEDGAAVVVIVALGDEEWRQAIGFSPRGHERLSESGLPSPADDDTALEWGPGVGVVAPASSRDWWQKELAAWSGVGVPCQWRELPENPAEAGRARRSELASALGIPARGSSRAGGDPTILSTRTDSPLARQWARIAAARWQKEAPLGISSGGEAPVGAIELAVNGDGACWGASDFLDGEMMPMPANPFGGTVVVVVPEGLPPEVSEEWHRLETEDVTRKRSRFVGTRVAVSGSDRDLSAILDELRAENKSVVLVVPARFCADADEMRALKRASTGHDEGLRISWLPGLGGVLVRKAPMPGP